VVAYRFCRPDDIPLLVRAVNECGGPPASPELAEARVPPPPPAAAASLPTRSEPVEGLGPAAAPPPLTEDGFRRWMKHLDVWPSNSMLALDGDGTPLAVSIGTKRPDEVLVFRVAVRPDQRRRGHGRHLVTSLSQKLAVLGPERLVAEVPADDPAAVAFAEALGWTREEELVDRLRPAPADDAAQPVPDELVVPVTVGELEAAGVLAASPRAAWQRSLPALRQRADQLVGIALAHPDGIEAHVLVEPFATPEGESPDAPPLDVLAAGCREESRAELLLGLLFRWLSHASRRPLRIPRLAPGELPSAALAAAGFAPADRWVRYAARAKPL
jgi:ribosomal protein S18 acetylase RimI-like enzyme